MRIPALLHSVQIRCLVIATFVVACRTAPAQVEDNQQQLRFFEERIRPLLHTKCVSCHGATKQSGDLRLDSKEGLMAGGESGEAIAIHESGASLLMEAVRYESFEMPPGEQLSQQEISDLQRWIDQGAIWPVVDGKSVRLEGAAFTEKELNYWALQPVRHPAVPTLTVESSVTHPIDRFILARQMEAGIKPAPAAEPGVLLRRLYFGLLGVPPSPADLEQFSKRLAETQNFDQTWQATVEQLLADRRYGEHWARYWLDIVRYAESDGFRADFYRPEAWRYRDYVVDAFNNDKPYDRFVEEQLAGDELYPDDNEARIATGYLRTYLYEYNQRDARTQQQDILNQITDVTGEAFMGLSVGCARCHDHKFDPILQADYFRLQAAFGSMLAVDDFTVATPARRQQHAEQLQQWKRKTAELQQQRDELRAPYLKKAARSAVIKFPEDVQAIMALDEAARSPLQVQLADLVNRQILYEYDRLKYSAADQKKIDALEQQIKELAGDKPADLPTALTVRDTGSTPATIHIASNPELPEVTAGGLTILDSRPFNVQPLPNSTGARSALAQWLTDSAHPLTARVIVNRIWQHHFGTGLVATASDFGSLGQRPSHPELLDWLASEFIANGYRIKWLHRQILTSAVYRMSAFHPHAAICEQTDPGNQLRWRFPIRRLSAEQIRDAMLTCSGELSSDIGGPSVSGTTKRRALYIKQLRNTPDLLLKSLDGTDGLNSLAKRNTTTTPIQALNLMNGTWVNERAAAMAERVIAETRSSDPAAIVDRIYRISLGRSPSPSDRQLAVNWIQTGLHGQSARPTKAISLSTSTGDAIAVNTEDSPLSLPDSSAWNSGPFTVVGAFRIDSLYPDATVRTIASSWNSNNRTPGWAIGITSEKSAYKPRNFILQVVTQGGYEVVASGLRPELNVPYLMAVTVSPMKSGKARAAFYLRPWDETLLSRSLVDFKTLNGLEAKAPLVVGGRHQQSRHRWDGVLDQIAVYPTALPRKAIDELFEQKLQSQVLMRHAPSAAWDFDRSTDPLASLVNTDHKLQRVGKMSQDPLHKVVADLCHVLLNSNEFVYLD